MRKQRPLLQAHPPPRETPPRQPKIIGSSLPVEYFKSVDLYVIADDNCFATKQKFFEASLCQPCSLYYLQCLPGLGIVLLLSSYLCSGRRSSYLKLFLSHCRTTLLGVKVLHLICNLCKSSINVQYNVKYVYQK